MIESYLPLLVALAGGYLLGSIPFGLILTRLSGLGDIRKMGSGSIGATNVLRTGRKGLAAATLLLDCAKGALSAWLGLYLFGFEASLVAGLGALLGHLFPVWLGFKGGKGVATSLGVLLVVTLPLAVLASVVWILAALAFRVSSLAALLAVAAATAAAWVLAYAAPEMSWTGVEIAILVSAMAVLVCAKHRENIARLLQGTEPRIGQGGKAS